MLNTLLQLALISVGLGFTPNPHVHARRNFEKTRKHIQADAAGLRHKTNLHSERFVKRQEALVGLPGLHSSQTSSLTNKWTKRAEGPADDSKSVTVSLSVLVKSGLDIAYVSNATFGSGDSEQQFALLVDTGSGDTWVPSAQGDYEPSFQCSGSCTPTNEQWSTSYGDGTGATGYLVKGPVSWGGLQVDKQVFALADTDVSDTLQPGYDGLIGISFPGAATDQSQTLIAALGQAGKLSQDLFGVYMKRSSAKVKEENAQEMTAFYSSVLDGAVNTQTAQASAISVSAESESEAPYDLVDGGAIHLGFIDRSMFQGDLTYADVLKPAYWEVQMEGMSTGSGQINGTSVRAAIDTGTSLIYLPTQMLKQVAKSIGASSLSSLSLSTQTYYSMECDKLDALKLSINIGGTDFQVNADDLDMGSVSAKSNQCVLGLMPMDITDPDKEPMAILGAAFLKNVYSVFDIAQQRVGFASLSDNSKTETITSGEGANATESEEVASTGTTSTSRGTGAQSMATKGQSKGDKEEEHEGDEGGSSGGRQCGWVSATLSALASAFAFCTLLNLF